MLVYLEVHSYNYLIVKWTSKSANIAFLNLATSLAFCFYFIGFIYDLSEVLDFAIRCSNVSIDLITDLPAFDNILWVTQMTW